MFRPLESMHELELTEVRLLFGSLPLQHLLGRRGHSVLGHLRERLNEFERLLDAGYRLSEYVLALQLAMATMKLWKMQD